jgi:mono/diheme cytochrome c family protein
MTVPRKLLPHPFLAIVAITPCCGPSYVAPPVTAALAQRSKAPVSELQRGHEVHQAKCAKCHAFEDPADYGVAELRDEIMPVMARKAKLDSADEKAVLAYLLAVRGSTATR